MDDRQVHLGRADFKVSYKLINRFHSRLNTHTQYADALKMNSNILMLLSCFYCNLIYFSSSFIFTFHLTVPNMVGNALFAHTFQLPRINFI